MAWVLRIRVFIVPNHVKLWIWPLVINLTRLNDGKIYGWPSDYLWILIFFFWLIKMSFHEATSRIRMLTSFSMNKFLCCMILSLDLEGLKPFQCHFIALRRMFLLRTKWQVEVLPIHVEVHRILGWVKFRPWPVSRFSLVLQRRLTKCLLFLIHLISCFITHLDECLQLRIR